MNQTKCRYVTIAELATEYVLRGTSHPRKKFASPTVDVQFRIRQTKTQMCLFLSTEFGDELDET